MSAHELRAALEARGCEVNEIERLDAPSPLPPPEGFMDALDPIYSSLPTYSLLDETLRGELRVLLAEEARRWIKEDVAAGRTAKAHLAIARRSSRPCWMRVSTIGDCAGYANGRFFKLTIVTDTARSPST